MSSDFINCLKETRKYRKIIQIDRKLRKKNLAENMTSMKTTKSEGKNIRWKMFTFLLRFDTIYSPWCQQKTLWDEHYTCHYILRTLFRYFCFMKLVDKSSSKSQQQTWKTNPKKVKDSFNDEKQNKEFFYSTSIFMQTASFCISWVKYED